MVDDELVRNDMCSQYRRWLESVAEGILASSRDQGSDV